MKFNTFEKYFIKHRTKKKELEETKFLYFGYGSNMLLKKLQNDGSDDGPKRCPSAEYKYNCWVENYEFSFGKLSQDGSGKCNITKTEDDKSVIRGVLFSILENEKNDLTDAEGANSLSATGYKIEHDFVVRTEKSDEFPDGTAKTVTYIATGTGTDDKTRIPFDWYKAQVVQGAKCYKLPPWYIEKIENDFTDKKDRDDPTRDQREWDYLA